MIFPTFMGVKDTTKRDFCKELFPKVAKKRGKNAREKLSGQYPSDGVGISSRPTAYWAY